jgi:hypothetical protein
MQHIEKSGFRAGEYVGYCSGRVFKITRVLNGKKTIGWQARAALGSVRENAPNGFRAATLKGLNDQLANAA